LDNDQTDNGGLDGNGGLDRDRGGKFMRFVTVLLLLTVTLSLPASAQSYDDVARYPDRYIGHSVSFRGKVVESLLQKPFHRLELGDTLAKLLTPKEPSVDAVIAAAAETSP
jgi:hypothetical protein